MDFVGVIFARGNSKGLPKKNILTLKGRPLIEWAIVQALSVPRIRRLIVSTDSDEIGEVAKNAGAEVPFMRPAHLANDTAPEFLAWRHVLQWLQQDEGRLPDGMVSVPTTSPLRRPCDIDRCLDVFENVKPDVVVTVREAARNPWFNMVTMDDRGVVTLVNSSPNESFSRRQDAPKVYDMTTVAYVARPKFVLSNQSVFDGNVCAVEIPFERGLDIDTVNDFQIAELFMEREEQAYGNVC